MARTESEQKRQADKAGTTVFRDGFVGAAGLAAYARSARENHLEVVVQEQPDGDVIGRGSYYGGPDYEFVVASDGQVPLSEPETPRCTKFRESGCPCRGGAAKYSGDEPFRSASVSPDRACVTQAGLLGAVGMMSFPETSTPKGPAWDTHDGMRFPYWSGTLPRKAWF